MRKIKTLTQFINESVKSDEPTLQAAMQTPEFQQILDKGFTVASTPIQLQNGTLVLLGKSGINKLILVGKSGTIRQEIPGRTMPKHLGRYEAKFELFWSEAFKFILTYINPTSCDLTKFTKNEYSGISEYLKSLNLSENDISKLSRIYKIRDHAFKKEEVDSAIRQLIIMRDRTLLLVVNLFFDSVSVDNIMLYKYQNEISVNSVRTIILKPDEEYTIYSSGEVDTYRTNSDIKKFKFYISGSFPDEKYVSYNQQYKIFLQDLDGNSLDKYHDIDIHTSKQIGDLW